jgi:hypothetical protein
MPHNEDTISDRSEAETPAKREKGAKRNTIIDSDSEEDDFVQ